MRWTTAVVAFAAFAAAAGAATYDDFTQAVSAGLRGDTDYAIKGYTAALAAGDLVPAYVAAAHLGRAQIYYRLGRCSDALADVEAAAAVQARDRESYFLGAHIKLCLKDAVGAQKDFDAGLGGIANPDGLFQFGQVQWRAGAFAEARADFDNAMAAVIADKDRADRSRYIALWQVITADRLGVLDRAKLQEAVDFLAGGRWPMPILEFYLGHRTIEEVVATAARGDSDAIAGQKCEADFYLAEWHIARGDTAAAKPLIVSALAGCPPNFIERLGAKAEAERLGLKEDKP